MAKTPNLASNVRNVYVALGLFIFSMSAADLQDVLIYPNLSSSFGPLFCHAHSDRDKKGDAGALCLINHMLFLYCSTPPRAAIPVHIKVSE